MHHRLDKSRSQRILWLLEELNYAYDVQVYHRDPTTKFAPAELKKIHALGKSPVVSLTPAGSDTPLILAESGFIIEYLLDHLGGSSTLLPKRYREGMEGQMGGETEEWLRFRYLMNYTEGSLMMYLTMILITHGKRSRSGPACEESAAHAYTGIKTAPVPFFIKPITGRIAGSVRSSFVNPNLKTHLEFLEEQIGTAPEDGQYICGPRLTGADILLSFPLIAARAKGVLREVEYPKLHAYTGRLEAEPGYKRAVDRVIALEGSYDVVD